MNKRIREIIISIALLATVGAVYIYSFDLFFNEIKMLEVYAVKNHCGEPEVILLNEKNDDGTGIVAGKCGDGAYVLSYKPEWIFLKRNNISSYIPSSNVLEADTEDLTVYIDRHETSGYIFGYCRDENIETVEFHHRDLMDSRPLEDTPEYLCGSVTVDKYGFFYQKYSPEWPENAIISSAPTCIAGYDAEGNMVWHDFDSDEEAELHFAEY